MGSHSGSGGFGQALSRPRISYEGGRFLHNGYSCRVVMRRGLISVGCSDVTPEALRALLAEHERRFTSDDAIVVQP